MVGVVCVVLLLKFHGRAEDHICFITSVPGTGEDRGPTAANEARRIMPALKSLSKPSVLADDVRAHKGKVRVGNQIKIIEEQDFDAAMRQAAISVAVADEDGDKDLTFDEFANLVREREVTDEEDPHTDRELRSRFADLDIDGSGTISMSEYVTFSLRDVTALSTPTQTLAALPPAEK